MDAKAAGKAIVKKLTAKPPYGAKVTAEIVGSTPWWTTDPEGPAFEAARRALKAGYGKETAMIGAGGSIGFVGPFADLLGGAPCLLMGVEDPLCNAHSENESLHLGDWLQVHEVGHPHVRRALAGADEEALRHPAELRPSRARGIRAVATGSWPGRGHRLRGRVRARPPFPGQRPTRADESREGGLSAPAARYPWLSAGPGRGHRSAAWRRPLAVDSAVGRSSSAGGLSRARRPGHRPTRADESRRRGGCRAPPVPGQRPTLSR